MTRPCIAILAQYPAHLLENAAGVEAPAGHYATWLPQLAGEFAGQPDFDIHWIALVPGLVEEQTVRELNQTFHLLPVASGRRALTLFRRDRRRIRSVLDSIRPFLVHGWGTEDVYALAAATSGSPNLVSMQGILSDYVLRCKMHPREYLQAAIELFVLNRADAITTESEWGRKRVMRRAPRARVDLVEYGVQPHFLETEWNPDPNAPAAIFVGSIAPRKGIHDAVSAFDRPELRDKRLLVVGGDESEWSRKLKTAAPSNVEWLGRKSSEEIARLLSRAWCLVLPTRADTSPNVVKEARVIGLPVVTTPHGGQSTYVAEGTAGYLVEPGKVDLLTARLQDLLKNLDHTRQLGAQHHEEHRLALDARETARKFLEIYRSRTSQTNH